MLENIRSTWYIGIAAIAGWIAACFFAGCARESCYMISNNNMVYRWNCYKSNEKALANSSMVKP